MTTSDWRTVTAQDAVPEGEILGVSVDGRRIAIYNLGGRFYATDNVCTHAFALLSDGWIEGEAVECPLHGGRFDVATGKALGDPVSCDLRTFPVRIMAGGVQVDVGVHQEGWAFTAMDTSGRPR